MLYRPQRGGLEESLKEAKSFDTIGELLAHLMVQHDYAWDYRLHSPTYLVSIKNQPEGFLTDYEL